MTRPTPSQPRARLSAKISASLATRRALLKTILEIAECPRDSIAEAALMDGLICQVATALGAPWERAQPLTMFGIQPVKEWVRGRTK